MARRRGPPRGLRQPGIDDTQEQQTGAVEAGRAAEKEIPQQSVDLSENMCNDFNKKVEGVMSRVEGLRDFYLKNRKVEDFSEFFEQNHDAVEKLLKTDLNKPYQDAVKNSARRDALYAKMVKPDKPGMPPAIEEADLERLMGTISTKAYLTLVDKLSKDATRAVPLTADDTDHLNNATVDNFRLVLDNLKSQNKLTDQEILDLTAVGPKTAEQLKVARDEVFTKIASYDARYKTSLLPAYQKTVKEEERVNAEFDQYIEEYNRLVKGLGEQIQAIYDKEQDDKLRQKQLKSLSTQSGLPIKEGQVLWGAERNADGTPGGKNNRIEIKSLSFEGVAEPDPEMHPDFHTLVPTFEPVVTFNSLAQDGSGTVIEQKLTAANFMKWLVANQVTEKFESVQELENALDLPGFIKPGQSFEYLEPVKPAAANTDGTDQQPLPEAKTVTIVKVEDGKIYLSGEVFLDGFAMGKGLDAPHLTSELDFGQFARWYRKLNAVPEIDDLKKLDEMLELHHKKLVAELGMEEISGDPINLSDADYPLTLTSAYDLEKPPYQINKVENGLIEDSEGHVMTPGQFLRKVREDGLMLPTEEQLEEMKKIAEGKRDADQLDALAELENQMKQKQQPEGPAGKTVDKAAAVSAIKKKGYWSSLWEKTHFLNLIEIYEIFIKAPYDRIKAKLKDNSERRVAEAGKEIWRGTPNVLGLGDLPGIFEDKANGKIANDVKELEELYNKNKTTQEVFEILYSTNKKVVVKACLQFLSKKGVIRWEDDKRLWSVLNHVFPNTTYLEEFHQQVGPGAKVEVGDGTHERFPQVGIREQIRCLLDKNFSPGTFDSIDRENEGKYKSEKQNTADNMHRYEFMQGGIQNQLQKMLNDWENGVAVKSFEFDGLLTQAVQKMEFTFEQGIMFLIAGFSIPNKHGQTLLSYSRLNSYVGGMANHLMYFYFATGYPQIDENGNPVLNPDGSVKEGKISLNHLKQIYNTVIKKDIDENERKGKTGSAKFTAGKNTIEWIQKEMLGNSLVKKKLGLKAGSTDIDVGLYHYIGPNIRQEYLDKLLGKTYGSLQSTDALKNMYAGYNSQLIIKANMLEPSTDESKNQTNADEFANMLYGFIYFNNILKSRIKRDSQAYIRFNDLAFNSAPLADKKKKTGVFCNELENFTAAFAGGLAQLSGDEELARLAGQVVPPEIKAVPDEVEADFRESLYKNIMKMSKEKPDELAKLASNAASLMNGISGFQLTPEELKKQREESAA